MDLTERPGSSGGAYRIETRLGGGATGEVYAAWDDNLRRRVAVKRIRSDLADDAAARARFRRAAAAAAVLDHPAIVRIHTLIQAADGGDRLIMELIEGETLAERLRRGPLPVAAAARLAAEIAAGLAAAHALRIAHWHLAAANVMITPSGHAKLVGFGAASGWPPPAPATADGGAGDVSGGAATPAPSPSPGLPPGTPNLPPGATSDVFALGRILGEMLGGRERPGSEAPPALSGLVAELRREPASPRPVDPAAMARLAADLRGIADELDAAAPPPGPAATPPPGPAAESRAGGSVRQTLPAWARLPGWRRRAVIGAVALAAAAVAAVSGLAVLRKLDRLGGGRPLTVVVPRAVLVDDGAKTTAGTAAGTTNTANTPAATATDAARELLALALRTALLHAASNLEGVFAWPADSVDTAGAEPAPGRAGTGSAVRSARRLGADEALTARLSCQADTCQVTLSRVAARDGRLQWTESLEAAVGEPYLLAKAAERYAAEAFPGHRRRAGAVGLEVRPRDFAAYLALLRDLQPAYGGRLTPAEAPVRLAPIRAGSPRFVEATLLAAELAGGSPPAAAAAATGRQGRPEPLPRGGGAAGGPGIAAAFELLRQARLMAPADSRPLCAELAAALAAGQLQRARAALDELARIEPRAPAVLERRLPPAQLRTLGGASAAAH